MVEDRAVLMNTFTPSDVIVDPQLFSGRRSQIIELTDALHVNGACPIIYGDRGLGKSSLAIQGQLIAMGVNDLLQDIGAVNRSIPDARKFMTFYVTCSDEITNTSQLMQLLVNAAGQLGIDEAQPKRARQLVNRQTNVKFSLKFFEVGTTKTYQNEMSRIREEDLSQSEKLFKIVHLLQRTYDQPILFIIDELDRVKDTRGFASLVRNLSSEAMRFLLVGVAQNISEINFDHTSIERILVPIKVPRMGKGDLADIIDRAVARLGDLGAPYSFSPKARRKLVQVAGGFPWFVHVIGQRALVEAADLGHRVVAEDDITHAIQHLTKNRFAQSFSDTYQQCVRDSIHRERVLRTFASWNGVDIPTIEVYSVLRRIGVPNPSIYKGHLTSATYGAILTSPNYQRQGLVRFRDEMFKRYVFLRPSLYRDVDKEVEEATKSFRSTS